MTKEQATILIIVVSVVVFLSIVGYLGFCLFISNYMADSMCKPKHFKTKEEKEFEISNCGHQDGFDKYQRTQIEFVLSDGYVIHGDYSINNPKKFVICMHGHISNRESSLKYAYAFYRLGYSLLFFDHRSHGENVRGIVTMGYQEHKDALEIIKQIRDKFGEDIEIGLFGCSMGGATALLCIKSCKDLSFVVSDCAFASVEDLVRGFIKQHHSPYWPILPLTNLVFKKKYGFSFRDACPREDLKQNRETPVLFIHGKEDNLVYLKNVEMLYSNDNGPKELVIFEGANHCGSVTIDKQRYYKVIEDFINKYKRG